MDTVRLMDDEDILIIIRAGAVETSRDLSEADVLEILCEVLSHYCEQNHIEPRKMLAHFDSVATDN